jgi:hypothetical protein
LHAHVKTFSVAALAGGGAYMFSFHAQLFRALVSNQKCDQRNCVADYHTVLCICSYIRTLVVRAPCASPPLSRTLVARIKSTTVY